MKNFRLLSIIAILFTTFFSPCLFAANLLDNDDQKEGFSESTQLQKQLGVHDYTILNKNVNHTLEDIEDVEDDLGYDVSAVNAKLVTTNNQSLPFILGAVLQHGQTNEYHQYLITSTGLLSEATQPNAVKRAHKKRFHLIKATRGHVILQLLEWLQISEHYTITALHTNAPVCGNCYLIANNLWKKELPTNEKGCLSMPFPLLDKMPDLAQQYINTCFNPTFVKNFLLPMFGYISKEELQIAIQQKDKETAAFIASMQTTKDKQIQMLYQEINKQERQLNEKNKQITKLQVQVVQRDNQLNEKSKQSEEKDEQIQMLHQEINKKDNQLKANEQKIAALQKSLHRAKNKQPRNDNMEEVEKFFNNYKDVRDEDERTPFLFAAQEGQLAIAKLLKEQGANIYAEDKDGNNALHLACAFSNSEAMVTWLLGECKIGIETIGRYRRTPFLCAAQKGQLAIAKLLKERGANIGAKANKDGNALHLACLYSNSVDMINWLLDVCKISLETKGDWERTPFIFAAVAGKLEIAKLLKERGANLNAKNIDGNNALHLACMGTYNPKVINWLLDECKIGLEAKGGGFKRTPFLCAARHMNFDALKLLKKKGAKIDAKDKDGNNALHLACQKGNWKNSHEVIRWFINVCKLSLEAKGSKGRTPLLWAAWKRYFEIVKILIKEGADTSAKDSNGQTALAYFKKYNTKKLDEYLILIKSRESS